MLIPRVYRLRSPLLAALLAAVNAAAAEPVTYLAPGVDAEDLAASTQFYDTGKGYFYWDSHTDTTRALYEQTGDYSFLGELAKYITETEFSAQAFAPLNNDSATCWYNAGSNAIQYWQNTYGAFYKGDRPLPDGYTYAPENLQELAGTQGLQVNMQFYDNWTDTGGAATDAFDWYFGGRDTSGVDGGAFFRDYFYGANAWKSAYLFDGIGKFSMQKASDAIIAAFGLTLGEGGLQRTEEGLVPTLSAGNNAAAHALTCYGFSLGEDGMLDSLYIADSDDATYQLEHVYVALSADGGRLLMYEDAEHTRPWHGEGPLLWGVTGIYNIATPKALLDMYAEYSAADNPLLWNGEGAAWAATDTSPAQGAWDASVDGTPYRSNFQNGRIVRFCDTAGQRDITVQGPVATTHMLVDASCDYSFTGAEGASLRIGTLEKGGHGKARFTDLAILADSLLLHETGLELLGAASLEIGGAVRISGGEIASTGNTAYTPGNADYSMRNAAVEVTADTAATLRNGLDNVRLVNSGTGSLTVDASITGTFSAEARGGDISFINRGTGLSVNDLTLHAGRTVGVYRAQETTEEEETALLITGTLTAEADARLNANLTLGSDATLDVSATNGLGLMLGSALTLNPGISLSLKDMELIAKMSVNQTYGLFQGVDALTLAGLDRPDTDPVFLDAVGWFRGLDEGHYFIQWNGDNVGMVCVCPIPEPATGTLGLLALAALAARRRKL